MYNLSSSGETIGGTLRRFEGEVEGHRWRTEPFTIIFAVGCNDTQIENGVPWCEKTDVERDLRELLQKSHHFSEQVFFLGPLPVDDSRTQPVLWGDYVYTAKRVDEFETMYIRVCAEQNVNYISQHEAFWDQRADVLIDGLHPNDAGHELIHSAVKTALEAKDLLKIS